MPLSFDDDFVRQLIREVDATQRQANEFVRMLIQEVGLAHAGQPRTEVDAALRAAFADGGIRPDEPAFSAAVQAIADAPAGCWNVTFAE
jgi:hypothetical protein